MEGGRRGRGEVIGEGERGGDRGWGEGVIGRGRVIGEGEREKR